LVSVAVHDIPLSGGDGQEGQHVATRQTGDERFLGIDTRLAPLVSGGGRAPHRPCRTSSRRRDRRQNRKVSDRAARGCPANRPIPPTWLTERIGVVPPAAARAPGALWVPEPRGRARWRLPRRPGSRRGRARAPSGTLWDRA